MWRELQACIRLQLIEISNFSIYLQPYECYSVYLFAFHYFSFVAYLANLDLACSCTTEEAIISPYFQSIVELLRDKPPHSY